jgi:hypothetical protein
LSVSTVVSCTWPALATASSVVKRWIGSVCSTLSCSPPPSTLKRSSAWPAAATSAGQRTTTVLFAGAWMLCLASALSFNSGLAPACASCATISSVMVASIAFAVLFCTTAWMASLSPAVRKRGSAGRTSSGLVAIRSLVAWPTRVSAVRPRAVMRQVVRLSGSFSVTLAAPSSPVTTDGFQYAVSGKLRRISRSELIPPPPPLSPG